MRALSWQASALAFAAALFCAGLTEGLAHAQSVPSRASTKLVYARGDGAETCPSEAELREAIAARLGYDPFASDAPTTTRVTMWREGGKLLARIERSDRDGGSIGARSLDSDANGCGELASATSFAVAIALDPASFTRPTPAAEPTEPKEPKEPTPPAAPPAAPAAPKVVVVAAPPPPPPAPAGVPAEPATDTSFFFGASGHVAILAAPSVAPGFAAHVGVRYGAFSIGGAGRFDFPVQGEAEGGTGTVESALVLGELVPCGHLGPAGFCGVVAIGALRGAGYEVDDPKTDTTFFFAVGPRAEIEWRPVGPLGLLAHADLFANATRTTLELDGVEAYRTPLVSVVLGVGARIHLGEESANEPAKAPDGSRAGR